VQKAISREQSQDGRHPSDSGFHVQEDSQVLSRELKKNIILTMCIGEQIDNIFHVLVIVDHNATTHFRRLYSDLIKPLL